MRSGYQKLNNRSLDQWKVAELKEELKRRKLRTVGLKEDLVKRLDEAVRIERDAAENNTVSVSEPQPEPAASIGEAVPVNEETATRTCGDVTRTYEQKSSETIDTNKTENTGTSKEDHNEMDEKENAGGRQNDGSQVGYQHEIVDPVKVLVDISSREPIVEQDKVELQGTENSPTVGEVLAVLGTGGTAAGNTILTSETDVSEMLVTRQGSQETSTGETSDIDETKLENENSKLSQKNVDSVPQIESEDSEPPRVSGDSKLVPVSDGSILQMEFDSKLSDEDLLHNPSAPKSQVSEVNPILGSQVKSASVSTDSLSINENIKLKGIINTDIAKIEQDNIRVPTVEPSSSNVVPVSDESCSMTIEEPNEKRASVGDKNFNKAGIPDLSKTNASEDMVYPEKLKLDRSSGEGSMDEDLPVNTQLDSKSNIDELKEKSEIIEVSITMEECSAGASPEGDSVKKNEGHVDYESSPSPSAEKRKLPDRATIGNSEPSKKQRKWIAERVQVTNSGNIKLTSNASANVITPKDMQTSEKNSFARCDLLVNAEAPKERFVPPSERTPTNSLKIDHFLRPFTLKAVKELLCKTGTVMCFWMDHIKTHCYVTFSSVEEAIGTRNAVYNLQWPPNGGRLLVADFVDPQEVKMKVEPSLQDSPTSAAPAPTVSETEPSSQPREQHHPPQLPPPPPPPLNNHLPPSARERLPSRQPVPETAQPVTLDDLFCKTKATPRIYFLPLSEERVAAKLATPGKYSKL